MKSKLVRALAAALVIGTLLLAGSAPYAVPGIRNSVAAVDVSQ